MSCSTPCSSDADCGGGTCTAGGACACPAAATVSLVTADAQGGSLVAIATDGANLYYSGFPDVENWGMLTPLYQGTNYGTSYTTAPGAFVRRLPIQGGASSIVATHDSAFGPQGLTFIGSTLYAIDPNSGGGTENQVFTLDLSSGAQQLIYDQNNTPRNGSSLAYDGSSGWLYLLDAFGGQVYRITTQGGGFESVTPQLYAESGTDYAPQHYVSLAVAGGMLYLGDTGLSGVSTAGVYTHDATPSNDSWKPLVVGLPLHDVEGLTSDPDDDLIFFTDSGTRIYATSPSGGALLGPITHPPDATSPGFTALRGITYWQGVLYAVDGQNLNNDTANPGVIWAIRLRR